MVRRLLAAICARYLRLDHGAEFSAKMQSVERTLARRTARATVLDALLDGPLYCLDVGARGGPLPELEPYLRHFRFYLVEPEPQEAARLRTQGHAVVESLLGSAPDRAALKVLRNPGGSSTLSPDGPFMSFYAGPTDRFDVMSVADLPVTTIEQVCRDEDVVFDLLKLDTQGSELEIVRGLGDSKPLFIQSEIAFVPLYREQCTLYDLGAHLAGEGYVLFDLTYRRSRPLPVERYRTPRLRTLHGIPTHGDGFFMPDWTSARGRTLIQGRDLKFAALMLVFGMQDLLRYVLDQVPTPNHHRILDAVWGAAP